MRETKRVYAIKQQYKFHPVLPFVTYSLPYKNSRQIWISYATAFHFIDKWAGK